MKTITGGNTMRKVLLLLVGGLVLAISMQGQQAASPVLSSAPAQALAYPRKPPKEWSVEYKDMKKRMDRARERQAKADEANKEDIAIANLEQTHLQAQLPQGAGYDEVLDLWMPQPVPAPTPASVPVKPDVKPDDKPKAETK